MDKSLNQETYDRLKQDIMNFSLKPGDQVSAAKLAERYQVSRTPAREALVKLETEGLINIYPQSKSVISRINVPRAKQEWFIRKTLELGMVDAFMDKVTDQDIEQMRKYNRLLIQQTEAPWSHESVFRYLSYDNAFHEVTYITAGEKLSAAVIANTMAHYNRIRLLADMENYCKDRTVSTHDKLLEYAEARDREGYRSTLERHLSYIVKDIEEMGKKYPDYFEM